MLTTIWREWLHLLYPPLCRLCRTPLVKGEKELCIGCLADLPRTVGGVDLSDPTFFTPGLSLPTEKVSAFLLYERGNKAQRLIHELKYYDHPETGYWLARQAAAALLKADHEACRADVLVPIPLHPKKEKARGYNQAVPIAKAFQEVLGIPMVPNAVIRTRNTGSQTSLSTAERWQNVKGIFEVTDPALLAGKHILLIDDVLTTGATFASCAQTVLSVPGTTVSFFALAIARQ